MKYVKPEFKSKPGVWSPRQIEKKNKTRPTPKTFRILFFLSYNKYVTKNLRHTYKLWSSTRALDGKKDKRRSRNVFENLKIR